MDKKHLFNIYRVQDIFHGRGPWRPGFSHNWVIERKDHENLKPHFEEFRGLFQEMVSNDHYGSGCRSLKQLRRWFIKPEYEKLIQYGYQAVEMKVDQIIAESEIQCVFRRLKPLNEDINPVRLYG